MEAFSPGHLVVIAMAALVLFFGWKQLPDLTRSLARSLRIFRTEMSGLANDAQTVRTHISETAAHVSQTAALATETGALATPATAQTKTPQSKTTQT